MVPVTASQGELGDCRHPGGGSPCPLPLRPQELQAFLSLLEHKLFQEFLANDPCFQISDKYLLAMVLVYFRRAQLQLSEFTLGNLFLALYLANDMEEDLEDPKCVIFQWALGADWRSRVGLFLHQRDALWARMDFRAVVSRQCCEQVMDRQPFHWAWTRRRRPHHGGAQRTFSKAQMSLPRGPGLSPPLCALCREAPCSNQCWHQGHHSPASSKCFSPEPAPDDPHSQALLQIEEQGGGLVLILPPQLRLEPGTYTLYIRLELHPRP